MAIRRLRNNLFHVGKFPSGSLPVGNPDREDRLIGEAMEILNMALARCQSVRSKFFEVLAFVSEWNTDVRIVRRDTFSNGILHSVWRRSLRSVSKLTQCLMRPQLNKGTEVTLDTPRLGWHSMFPPVDYRAARILATAPLKSWGKRGKILSRKHRVSSRETPAMPDLQNVTAVD